MAYFKISTADVIIILTCLIYYQRCNESAKKVAGESRMEKGTNFIILPIQFFARQLLKIKKVKTTDQNISYLGES